MKCIPAPAGRLTFVIVLTMTLTSCAGGSDEGSPGTAATAATAALPRTAAVLELPELIADVDPSVVTVAVGRQGIGSGVVYRAGGYVVTNAHVVGNARRVDLELADGSRTPAQVLAVDEITDLAVLLAEREDLPPATFQRTQPPVGELVVAIGSPLGFQNSATAGIVSGLGREIPGAAARGARSLVDLIQTDAAISPGNSGGALINGAGEIVGINEAYIPPGVGAVSLGFAIPAATVVDVADQLIEDGTATHPFVGVVAVSLTPQIARAFGMAAEDGALIQSVQRGSPAAIADIRDGDVMIRFDGAPIRSADDFLGELRGVRPGDVVEVEVRRGEVMEKLSLTVGTLGKRAD